MRLSTTDRACLPRWPLFGLSMFSVVLIMSLAIAQPAEDAAAQATLGGKNLTLVSCASYQLDLLCSPVNGAVANPNSRDVALAFDVGTQPGQNYQLMRVTRTGGAFNTTTLLTPFILPESSVGIVRDSVPAGAGDTVCYELIVNGGNARSDCMCMVFGLVQGTFPGRMAAALRQGNDLTASWLPVIGASAYLVYGLDTTPVQITTSTSVTLRGNGGLICAAVIPLDASNNGMGVSNILCGFPSAFVGHVDPTPTRTATPTTTVWVAAVTRSPLPTPIRSASPLP
jgi:hypothetical protein